MSGITYTQNMTTLIHLRVSSSEIDILEVCLNKLPDSVNDDRFVERRKPPTTRHVYKEIILEIHNYYFQINGIVI